MEVCVTVHRDDVGKLVRADICPRCGRESLIDFLENQQEVQRWLLTGACHLCQNKEAVNAKTM